jgi:hypothetical protein
VSARAILARARAARLSLRVDEAGVLRATGRVAVDLLAELRAHKAEIAGLLPAPTLPPEMAAILGGFPGAEITFRPPTPVPDEPQLGDWVWSQPLPPRRRKWR